MSQAVAERRTRMRSTQRARETRAGYLFQLPWMLGFVILTAIPMGASLYLAFTDYDLFSAPTWVGLDNFVALFHDPRFGQSVRVTLTYVLVGTPIKLAAALGVAMVLNVASRAQGFYRSAFYLPSLIAASVSIAIVWRAMFSDGSVVDVIQQWFGLPAGGWLGDPDRSMPMMILLAVWAFGAPMVIFLAGLKQIPVELYEAAEVDGASPLAKFTAITIPMLSPVIFFNLLLETIHAFQIFGSAFIISNGTGGPAGSTLFYTLYLYQRGFGEFRMGYAAAMAWLLVIAVGVVTAALFRTSGAWVHYGGDTR